MKLQIILLITFSIFSTHYSFSQSKKKTNPKIGLVLSGGGAKGIAHIGVLKELEKKGIKPDYIVGTSFGALVAGFYAIGYSPEQMEEIIKNSDWDYLINDVIKRKNVLIGQDDKNKNAILNLPLDGVKPSVSSGLYTGQNILTFFEITCKDYNRPMDFDDFEIPFRCIGTNIETGEEKIFDKGLLPQVLRASMSIPSIFTPFMIDDELYVDGGLVNNFPTDVVKEMGADIIIGVDVGAVLYKKDEIKSIFQILDQSSSFYNARISRKNKKLCDIYIRPDISNVSAMDFDNVTEIIKKGTESAIANMANIEKILQERNYQTQTIIHKLPVTDSLHIVSINVNSEGSDNKTKHSINKLVQGKLHLKTPVTLSKQDLEDRINQVYGSKYFSQVSLQFTPIDSAYNMTLNVKEKTENNFNIGARFDQTYGVNILLKAEFRNLMIYGSLLELKGVIGQSPHFSYRYTTDRGSNIGFGSSLNYDFFNVFTYENNKIFSTYNFQRAALDVFVHSHLNNYNRIVLGGETSLFSLSSIQSIADINDKSNFYYNMYLAYVTDTWDDAYYPSKGFKLKVRGELIGANNYSVYTRAWVKANNVFSINRKLKVIAEGFVGLASIGIDTTLLRFEVGGMEKERIQWYSSLPGLRFLETGSNNIWIAKISPRYEFYKNNYLTYTFAMAALDNNTEELFTNAEQFYSGMSLTYGFNSMFGPLEISIDYSLQSYQKYTLISLGYWF